jgi:hypothetical protein
MHDNILGRLRFTIWDDINFNYWLIINVIYINGKSVLYAIDEIILFQAAKFLANMQTKTI